MEKIVIKLLIKFEKEALKELKEHLERIFNLPVEITSQTINCHFAFNPIRNQYLASLILEELEKFKKYQNEKWLAICDFDLYSEGLNFIFGEANPNSQISIISLTRLREEFYGLPKNENLFLERIKKEAVHELGHLFYLGHCQNRKCVMYFSNSLLDTDEKNSDFCQKCKKNLQSYFQKK
jgi:archaemetzincin